MFQIFMVNIEKTFSYVDNLFYFELFGVGLGGVRIKIHK